MAIVEVHTGDGSLGVTYRVRQLIVQRMQLQDAERSAVLQVGLLFVVELDRSDYGWEARVAFGFNRPSFVVKVRV